MTELRPSRPWPAGSVETIRHRSRVLEGNPWNDPLERDLNIYLPSDYDPSGRPLPCLWDLAAFTNAGPGHLNWRNHGENLVQRLDRLIGSGEMAPVVVAIPDCYTSLGGNQYVNSPAVGNYADYLVHELVPLVSERFNVIDGPSGRGLFGKSSGGYGALYHAMCHPKVWGAAASHAGDAGFDLVFRTEFPKVCNVLNSFDGNIGEFIREFWSANQPPGAWFMALLIVAMAASYDPDTDNPERIRLPFDLQTCEVDEERWACWMRWDPVTMAARHSEALKNLRGLYIDVGRQDQYHMHFGARRLHRELERLGVAHHYEEFDGTHSGIDWRLDHSLPFLARTLNSDQKRSTSEA